MNTIDELKALLNKGYSVISTTENSQDNYITVECSYLETPYSQDIPEDKVLFIKSSDYYAFIYE